MYSRVLFVALGLVAAVGTAVVYFVGGNLAISGTISIGTVAAFVIYVGQIYQPLAQLTNSRVDVLTALVSFERVFEVLDFPAAIADRPDAIELVDPQGRVEFDHVWFRHPPGDEVSLASLEAPGTPGGDEPSEWILRDVSLAIEPGETVALVGPSGAGKTTIAMLVPRMYEAVAGRGARRRPRRARPHARVAARRDRARAAGPAPLPRHAFAPTCCSPRPTRPTPSSKHALRARAHLGPRRVAARRARHRRRRARLSHVGRREATPRDRARCC